ncbi:MAG: ECF transporter S component [Oscillospiraceae bacterium]
MENTQIIKTPRVSTQKIVILGLFAAISTLLMYVETPLPFMPPFLKLDVSGVPILIAAFLFGPWEAITVTLLKDLVHLLSTQTGGVGELADFLILASFSVVVAYVYRNNKTKKGAGVSLLFGAITIAIMGGITNKFLLIPFYSKVMPIDAIVSACNKINPMIDSINGYIFFGAIPFNIIKGVVISFITLLVYKKLSVYIKSRIS